MIKLRKLILLLIFVFLILMPSAALAGASSAPSDEFSKAENITIKEINEKGYWKWWQGALALGLLTVGFWFFVKTPLGISTSWERAVAYKEEKERSKAETTLRAASPDQIRDALIRETLAQFGEDAYDKYKKNTADSRQSGAAQDKETQIPSTAPLSAHIIFLLMIAVGALIASFISGSFKISLDLGIVFTSIFGKGWLAILILLLGGAMVGFGTRLASGCPTGHGLSGAARLQPGSIIATSAFFGTAILISLLLERIAW